MRAGLLPIFGLSEISVITGLQSLWKSDVFLALVVTIFALVAPYIKTIGTALIQWNLMDARVQPALNILGKLAMADIFPDRALYHAGQRHLIRHHRNRMGPVPVHRLHSGLACAGLYYRDDIQFTKSSDLID